MASCFVWVVLGDVVKVLGVWQGLVLDSDMSFLSANQNKSKNI